MNNKSQNMPNILHLRNKLRENNIVITGFYFRFNNIEYNVLFECLNNKLEKDKFYIALITFIDPTDNRELQVRANTKYFDINPVEFRKFFKIQYYPNLGNIFNQFYKYFNLHIPLNCTYLDDNLKSDVVTKLNQYEKNNGLYCFKVKRNGLNINNEQIYRTVYNDNKTRLLRPELYKYFANEPRISFCYTNNIEKEKSDFEIIANFTKNQEF